MKKSDKEEKVAYFPQQKKTHKMESNSWRFRFFDPSSSSLRRQQSRSVIEIENRIEILKLIGVQWGFNHYRYSTKCLLHKVVHHSQQNLQHGDLKSEDYDVQVAIHYGILYTSSILPFDPIQRLLAIATLDGRIKVIGGDGIDGLLVPSKQLPYKYLEERLSVICRSNHKSIIKLLGTSISGDYIYLVYEFIEGSNLAECLKNPRNLSFTVPSTWMSRMQIATDLAHGLDYVHNSTGLNLNIVHNHINISSIIIAEPSFNARICHFGTAQLCGETGDKGTTETKIERVRDYMSPEFRSSGVVTQKSDVFTFRVVILELLSGREPLKYWFDKKTGDFLRTSVMDTAAAATAKGKEGLMRWVDGRMNDSFPVEVAEKLICLALDCVHVDTDKRPEMRRVAGKISKLYLESRIWSYNIKLPTEISVSLAPI